MLRCCESGTKHMQQDTLAKNIYTPITLTKPVTPENKASKFSEAQIYQTLKRVPN